MAKPDLPRVIHLRLEAPPKPDLGQPCNGCGVCCAAEPCPLGVLVSRRRHGACRALQWSAALGRYRCGLVSDPTSVLEWLPEWAGPAVAALSRRWISAASGCDAALIVD